ncbi:hypothetical protein [Streptomyces sp. AcE210]|uniref:hypothetical protein n=1 Tax=Streptomyces sp. AcE210 TaxID=2292703 RepID=UPI0019D2165F|nr:hypothetical protein [Streptomyces sp. AcE210]
MTGGPGGKTTAHRMDAADPADIDPFFAQPGPVDHLVVAVSGSAGSEPFAALDLAELAAGSRGSSGPRCGSCARPCPGCAPTARPP